MPYAGVTPPEPDGKLLRLSKEVSVQDMVATRSIASKLTTALGACAVFVAATAMPVAVIHRS
jgi:hypothetical protein